jgi:hypothetical protein
MSNKRRRFKQTTPLEERITAAAEALRDKASALPAGDQRDAVLRRLESIEAGRDIVDFLIVRSGTEARP